VTGEAEGDSRKRPVIIHRAVLGSIERFAAILTENFGGKWPFWLSPRQAIVIPVTSKLDAYADEVRLRLHNAGLFVDADLEHRFTLNKKIANAQLAQYNYILGGWVCARAVQRHCA
jgi:threonyl-tRNA synthetase